MKINSRIKLIVSSIALLASLNASAGLGGLQVNSNLGEPFSGSVTVTGNEAKALADGAKVNLSNSNLKATVKKTGDDRAVVNLRSNAAVNDPVLVFQMGVGSQTRQYTAILDPKDYVSAKAPARNEVVAQNNEASRNVEPKNKTAERTSAVAAVSSTKAAAPVKSEAQPKAEKRAPVKTVKGGQYSVREGETLSEIAARLSPAGISTNQAVQQLVKANPKIFPKGNPNRIIYPGDLLNIPFGAAVIADTTKPAQPAVPPVKETTPPAQTVTASEPVLVTPASTVVTEPAIVAASTPELATASAASTITAPTKTASAPTVAPTAPPGSVSTESESGSKWRYLLWGGLGLIALFILSRLLGKKNAPIAPVPTAEPEVEPFAEDDVYTESVVDVSDVAAKPVADSEDLAIEDDFDSEVDDIFLTQSTEKETPAEQEERLNLDLHGIDKQQSAILTSSVTQDEETNKRKDVDWDKIESTDSVYEPEPTSPIKPIHVVTDTVAETEWVEETVVSDKEPSEFSPTQPEIEETLAQQQDAEWVNPDSAEGAIALDDSEAFINEDIGDTDHVIEWEGAFEGKLAEEATVAAEPSFVTESVGMTAPLEAKYELAEMYVEIGDPEAARETLKELLEESDGSILTRARALLDKLDA